jgi:hypothetical protein
MNNSQEEIFAIDIIISILIGVVIGLIFGYMVFKKKLYKGPNSKDVVKEVHEDKKGKYIWEPVITICPLGTIHKDH